MTDAPKAPEWPRKIWMAEREEYDQGVVSAVLSKHATVERFEGDKERDRDFHGYVDEDIHESLEKYHKSRFEALTAERDALAAEVERLRGVGLKFADTIDDLNTLPPDEDGHCWRKSDLIDQEVMTFRAALEEGKDG